MMPLLTRRFICESSVYSRTISSDLLVSAVNSFVFQCSRHIHNGDHHQCYQDKVKVRFAPSPTGLLHLGGVRTAFINFLFARKHQGMFILRIEDTDQNRVVPGSVEKIQKTLEWCGLRPDEGPFYGDSFKPYFQSQRLDLYQKYVRQLLSQGHAYRCFCDELTLSLIRKEAMRTRQVPRYDNRCRHLTKEQIQQRLDQGRKFAIRFKLKPGPVVFQDLVMGQVSINLNETESDFIILKSDGFPTYHLANVVDDHHMQISHVLRGIEWLHSTPKHLMLYESLSFDAPLFAHLPLILLQGGGKLSKRHEHVNLESLRRSGFRPDAILNYLASIGGGFNLDLSRNNDRIYSTEELIQAFDLNLVRNIPNKLDDEKLKFFNRLALQKAFEQQPEKLLEELRQQVETKLQVKADAVQLKKALTILRDRVVTINEMVNEYSFIWTDNFPETLHVDDSLMDQVLDHAISLLSKSGEQLGPSSFEAMKQFCVQTGIKYSKYMQCLRIALTGKKDGLPIGELYEILGQDSILRKLHLTKKKSTTAKLACLPVDT